MKLRGRRIAAAIAAVFGVVAWIFVNSESYEQLFVKVENTGAVAGIESGDGAGGGSGDTAGSDVGAGVDTGVGGILAREVVEKLEVKGRAPKTGYSREEFYNGWPTVEGCNLRQRIIKREFGGTAVLDGCNVVSGEYDEPYTGEHKVFAEREEISRGVQIDHVVALSDAWQKGAQYMTAEVRYEIATDPLNLLAVDAGANGGKSDGDAATWLPPNKKFRCQYVARQASVKYKYSLWVTAAEKEAMLRVLENCPNERAVGV